MQNSDILPKFHRYDPLTYLPICHINHTDKQGYLFGQIFLREADDYSPSLLELMSMFGCTERT